MIKLGLRNIKCNKIKHRITLNSFLYYRSLSLISTELYTLSGGNVNSSEPFGKFQETIKKSHFMTTIYDINSKEHALEILNRERDDKATHNCYAYRVLSPKQTNESGLPRVEHIEFASSDDGEVTGTAGKQILTVLEREHLVNVLILVIRYYGGIKLGVGGLARAYSSAARGVVHVVDKKELLPYTTCTITGPISEHYIIHNIMSVFNHNMGMCSTPASMLLIEENTTETTVCCVIRMDIHLLESFTQKVYSSSRNFRIS